MKSLLLFVLSIFFAIQAYPQSGTNIYVPREIQNAMKDKTRDLSGRPGANYWQNQTDYKIKARLDTKTGKLVGEEVIDFYNNSPDTLTTLYIHLYQDLFKKGVARDWDLGQTDIVDGLTITELAVGADKINPDGRGVFHNSSLMGVRYFKPILPRSKVEIKVSWEVQLPMFRTVRMGRYDSTSYMVGYWYPKLAVYDDTHGWSTVPHTGNCEYYSDYGNFNVEIELPANYTAWSSGELLNCEELYSKHIFERIGRAKKSENVVNIITSEDRKAGKILKTNGTNVWKFKGENLPDFAFAASDKYLWDGVSAKNGDGSVFVSAVYPATSKDFHLVADLGKKSIEYFSSTIPGIPFPYKQMTAFNGHGGMEFPGMINDGDGENLTSTIFVTSHEIGHSYFPFAVGTNEQKYAWVDEGLITYFPRKVIEKFTNDTTYVVYKDIVASYNRLAGTEVEIPLMVSSINTRQSYRYAAYGRSAAAFYTLNKYLGDEVFYRCLNEYYNRWQGKHPTPYDLFYTFNEVSGENLSWFWKPWFFELGYADFGIKSVQTISGELLVEIENPGGFPSHVCLVVEFEDNQKQEIVISADEWKDKNKVTLEVKGKNIVKRIWIDNSLSCDVDTLNNNWNREK